MAKIILKIEDEHLTKLVSAKGMLESLVDKDENSKKIALKLMTYPVVADELRKGITEFNIDANKITGDARSILENDTLLELFCFYVCTTKNKSIDEKDDKDNDDKQDKVNESDKYDEVLDF